MNYLYIRRSINVNRHTSFRIQCGILEKAIAIPIMILYRSRIRVRDDVGGHVAAHLCVRFHRAYILSYITYNRICIAHYTNTTDAHKRLNMHLAHINI